MPDIVVFDIETYRPNWRIRRTSREDLNPARNTITTTGVFDGEKLSISPVIRNLEEERKSVEFFLRKLEESRGSTLVGYNTLHFDIPYLVYKSKKVGSNCDLTQFQPLALYWILPYWLHNTLDGREFFNKGPRLGNLWKFENVVKYILREKANPFSNFDVLRLWEEKRFDDIEALVKDEIAERPRLELSAVINPRLKDAIIRELFAHAFLRTAFQNGFKNIDELQYTEEDVDFI